MCVTSVQGSDPSKLTRLVVDNMRYAFNWCTLGFPNNTNLESTPCEVSCTPLLRSTTFDISNTSTAIAPYGYCDVNGGAFSAGVSVCSSCLRLVADQTYIANCELSFTLDVVLELIFEFQSCSHSKRVANSDRNLASCCRSSEMYFLVHRSHL